MNEIRNYVIRILLVPLKMNKKDNNNENLFIGNSG